MSGLNTGERFVFTADIGGTSIKLAVVALGGDGAEVQASDALAVADRLALGPQLPRMVEAWRRMCGTLGLEPASAAGVSLGFAGIVDSPGRRVTSVNGKFEDAPSLDLMRWSREALGVGLWLENDARLACLGEWKFGAGRGIEDVAMLMLGTGVGTSAVMQGRLVRGGHGQAGVLGGHITHDLDGPLCTCGNVGCAEALASTDRLAELIERCTEAGDEGSPLHATNRTSAPAYAQVAEWSDAGDALAVRVRDFSIRVWGAAAVGLVHAYDPAVLVIGGGIGRAWPAVLDGIAAYLHRHAWTPWGRVDVRRAALGDDAALLGAACLPGLDV